MYILLRAHEFKSAVWFYEQLHNLIIIFAYMQERKPSSKNVFIVGLLIVNADRPSLPLNSWVQKLGSPRKK